jgi:hypothetical protein
MQIIKSFLKLLVFVFPFAVSAQTTFLSQGDKAYQLIDRLEIKEQSNTDINFSFVKPYSRKSIVEEAYFMDNMSKMGMDSSVKKGSYQLSLSPVDEYDLHSLFMDNSEWVTGSKESFKSKTPFFIKGLYKTQPNLLEVDNNDLFLAVNPVLDFGMAAESYSGQRIFINTRGASIRGIIGRKIGFATSFSDNQERGPAFFKNYVDSFEAVPGTGFYKSFKGTGYDYFNADGYITFSATKFINLQFGYGKNFIGDGYRSLFLSDIGNGYPFLRISTKIWKFDYENLFMELTPQFRFGLGDTLLDKKYMAMHHLSLNVNRWLNLGVFESVVYGRKNIFEMQYLNPVIFLRYAEGNLGSEDNALAGFDFKANVAHHFQFYGQVLLDEFVLSQVLHNGDSWVNKWGVQLGAKYIDAFGIKNLDLQFETNRVRPFTYSHFNGIADYTSYNQPLAHPLGANFQEFIGIARYRPSKRIYLNGTLIYYYQGLDSAGKNYGGNPFESYNTRGGLTPSSINSGQYDNGYKVGGGNKATCLNALFNASYEVKENIFADLSIQYRMYKTAQPVTSPYIYTGNTTLISVGVRMNIARRVYDY